MKTFSKLLLEQEGPKNINEMKFEKTRDCGREEVVRSFEITLRLNDWKSTMVIISHCLLRTSARARVLLCVCVSQALTGILF